mmetsp:Transcript_56365/g.132158  ORF Transcript_56365/g.132158 Transcript_56365/m.132158 type:complete len:226 (-) Transcript_56365:712-1389(-)
MNMPVAAPAVVGKRDILLGLMKVIRVDRRMRARAAVAGQPARLQKSLSVGQIRQALSMAQLPTALRTRKRVDAMKAYLRGLLASQGTGRANLWVAFNIQTVANLARSIAFHRRVGAGTVSIASSATLTTCQGCARRRRNGNALKGSDERMEGSKRMTIHVGHKMGKRRVMKPLMMKKVMRHPSLSGLHLECQWAKREKPALAADFLPDKNRTAKPDLANQQKPKA